MPRRPSAVREYLDRITEAAERIDTLKEGL